MFQTVTKEGDAADTTFKTDHIHNSSPGDDLKFSSIKNEANNIIYPYAPSGLSPSPSSSHRTNVRHEKNSDKQFICHVCDFTTKYSGVMSKHKRIHTGEKFGCHICNNSYTSKFELKSHIQASHEANLLCQCCSKTFKSRQGLGNHLKKQRGEYLYECSFCQKKFQNKPHWIAHENMHKKLKPHSCDKCGKKYAYSRSLVEHKKECDGEMSTAKKKVYRCSDCRQLFNTRGALREHVRAKHSDKIYVCSNCSKVYNWRPSFTRHKKKCMKGSEMTHGEGTEGESERKAENDDGNIGNTTKLVTDL